jgi:hypothetical protein
MAKKGRQSDSPIYWLEDKHLYCACVSLGYEGAKRRRKYVYGQTAEEVRRKKVAVEHDRDQGMTTATRV